MKSFFCDRGDKLTEKAFMQSILISAVGFVICIVALCSMTFAWFSSETSSSNHTLTSGSFDLVVTVKPVQGEGEALVPTKDGGTYTYELKQGKYLVTLKMTEDSTVKGRCLVTIGGGETLSTSAIYNERTANCEGRTPASTDNFTFEIEIEIEPAADPNATTTVTFQPCWGEAVTPEITMEPPTQAPEDTEESSA